MKHNNPPMVVTALSVSLALGACTAPKETIEPVPVQPTATIDIESNASGCDYSIKVDTETDTSSSSEVLRRRLVAFNLSQVGISEPQAYDLYNSGCTYAWSGSGTSTAFNKIGRPFVGKSVLPNSTIPFIQGMFENIKADPDSALYPIDDVRTGRYTPQPGDLIFVKDPAYGRGLTHVENVISYDRMTKNARVVGYNYNDKVSETTVRLNSDPAQFAVANRFAGIEKAEEAKK